VAQRESRLSRKIMDELRLMGVFCFKVHGSAVMMAGLPDIVCCVNGRFVGFETKVPENAGGATARQLYVHDLIRKAGGVVHIVTSVNQAIDIIESLTLRDD